MRIDETPGPELDGDASTGGAPEGAAAGSRDVAAVLLTAALGWARAVGATHRVDPEAEVAVNEMNALADAAKAGDSVWCSYREFRSILEAARRVVGEPVRLREAAPWFFGTGEAGQLRESLAALGSPEAFLKMQPAIAADLMPMTIVSAQEGDSGEWHLSYALRPGFEPFEEFCKYLGGQLSAPSIVFGLGPSEVVEETCQVRGDDACRFTVRVPKADTEETQARRLSDMRTRGLEVQLEEFQRLVADLVSGTNSIDILERVALAAQRACGAKTCAICVEAGILGEEALQIGDPGPERSPNRVELEIRSAQRRYGTLVADDSSGVVAGSSDQIETFARLAAALLDRVVANEQARREAETANHLLELSGALAEIATPAEMAQRLARSVPPIVGCNRSIVYLVDPETEVVSLAGALGYPAEEVEELRGRPPHDVAGPADVLVPIVSETRTIGWVLGEQPSGELTAEQLTERLNGVAAQAAAAIANAYLLDRIRHNAFHDALTGLANRALLMDRLEQLLSRSYRSKTGAAALFIDLDGFKAINDSLGHEAGDKLLQTVAGRLSASVRQADTIARLGGDEFVVLLDGATMSVGPELVAERLIAVLSEPLELEGHGSVGIGASIGVAIAPPEELSASELLRNADIALYRAKDQGKGRYLVFMAEMQTLVEDTLVLEMDVRRALDRDQFFLVYQPIVNLGTGEVTGVEALLRWQHPIRGVVPPDTFIPLLECDGHIVETGAWVLAQACARGVELHKAGHPVDMTVNVAVQQLEEPDFVDTVVSALDASGLDPRRLVLEITESTLASDIEAIVPRLQAVRDLGVRIAIDDFGTGYSSLAYLQQLPIDTLKIDRSFIEAMPQSADSRALVRTMVQLGKALNLETLAEGIEDASQQSQLQDEQCDSGQGYLFAKPLASGDLEAFLQERGVTSTSQAVAAHAR